MGFCTHQELSMLSILAIPSQVAKFVKIQMLQEVWVVQNVLLNNLQIFISSIIVDAIVLAHLPLMLMECFAVLVKLYVMFVLQVSVFSANLLIHCT